MTATAKHLVWVRWEVATRRHPDGRLIATAQPPPGLWFRPLACAIDADTSEDDWLAGLDSLAFDPQAEGDEI